MLYSIEKISFGYFDKVFTYLLAQEKVSKILPSQRKHRSQGSFPHLLGKVVGNAGAHSPSTNDHHIGFVHQFGPAQKC